jgi:hypothetical protein
MTIEGPSFRKAVRTARVLRRPMMRFCMVSPLKRMLYRDANLEPTYYLGIPLRERLVSLGVEQFVSRTRTVADPLDVAYRVSPCC